MDADGGKEQRQPEGGSGLGSLAGDVGTAIVGQPFHPMAGSGTSEATLDRCDHQIAH